MIGQTIKHFRIEEEIGQGGMARVYKAWDSVLNRYVAVKALTPETRAATGDHPSDEYDRVLHEARAASRLDHPNIAPVYEVFSHDSRSYMVMQLVSGPSLRERLRRGPVPLAEAVQIMLSIARGLAEAHRMGVLHRDIKPENVLLTDRGDVKITDFGLARIAQVDQATIATGTIRGTPAYMPPELLSGLDPDARGDVFSAGVLFYEMLAGSHPFQKPHQAGVLNAILNEDPPNLSSVRPDVSPELSKVVRKMMQKEPEDRYADGAELLTALEAEVGVTPLNPLGGAPPARRRTAWTRPRFLVPAVAVLTLFVIMALYPWPEPAATRIMLSGRVTDPAREPVEGALVTIDGHSFLARTTSNGGFRGEIVDASENEAVLLRVAHDRYYTETRWVSLGSDVIDTLSFSLKPLARDAEGHPRR